MKRDEKRRHIRLFLSPVMCPRWAPSHLSSFNFATITLIMMSRVMEECEEIFDMLQGHSKGMFEN